MAGRGAGSPRLWTRTLAALALGAGAVAGSAACSPIATDIDYAPSDGVRVVLGDQLTIENLLILTPGEGEPALVAGGFINRGDEATTITLSFGEDGQSTTLQVAGDSSLLLPPPVPDDAASATEDIEREVVILDVSPGAPGSTVPVTISTPESGATTAQVPVLDDTLPPYDAYIEHYLSGTATAG